jgi:hypothetical protein
MSRFIAILRYYKEQQQEQQEQHQSLINNITSNQKDASDVLTIIRDNANNKLDALLTKPLYDQIKSDAIVINVLRAAVEDIPSFLETALPQGAPDSFNIKRADFTVYAAGALRFALTDYTYSKALNLYKIVKEVSKYAVVQDLATIHTQLQKYAVLDELTALDKAGNEGIKNIYLLHMYKLYQTDKASVQKFLNDGINKNIEGTALVKAHAYMEVLAHFIKLGMILNPEQFRADMNTMFSASNVTFGDAATASAKTLSTAEFNSLINSYLDDVDMPIKAIFKQQQSQQQQAGESKRRSRKFSRK